MMFLQQRNVAMTTLLTGGMLDLTWTPVVVWDEPSRVPYTNLPRYGMLANMPIEWNHGRLCLMQRRPDVPGITRSLPLVTSTRPGKKTPSD